MYPFTTIILFLLISFLAIVSSAKQDLEMVQMAQTMVLQAKNWAQSSSLDESSLFLGHHRRHHGGGHHSDLSNSSSKDESSLFLGRGGRGSGSGGHHGGGHGGLNYDNNTVYNYTTNNYYYNDNNANNIYDQRMAIVDCAKLYDQAEARLVRLVEKNGEYSHEDVLAWLSGAITSHRTCLDGLKERGVDEQVHPMSQNLTIVLNEALALHAKKHTFGSKTKSKGKLLLILYNNLVNLNRHFYHHFACIKNEVRIIKHLTVDISNK